MTISMPTEFEYAYYRLGEPSCAGEESAASGEHWGDYFGSLEEAQEAVVNELARDFYRHPKIQIHPGSDCAVGPALAVSYWREDNGCMFPITEIFEIRKFG